jgi:hypothetical protein
MGDTHDTVELVEQRDFTGVPADFLVRFFGHIAAELKSLSLEVPGDPQARRFPLEYFGSTVTCLVVRVDLRERDATVELTRERFENERTIVEVGQDPDWIATTLWRAAQHAAKPDELPS